jgi:hypothetical protein
VKDHLINTEEQILEKTSGYTWEPSSEEDFRVLTIEKAEYIIDVVSRALQNTDYPRFHPLSLLKGIDVLQIVAALKLRLANEFLVLSESDDFEKRFSEGVRLYSGIPLHIVTDFIPDLKMAGFQGLEPGSMEFKKYVIKVMPRVFDSQTNRFIDERLNDLETIASFGEFCRYLGPDHPDFWREVYERIEIEYTSDCPQGNLPVS